MNSFDLTTLILLLFHGVSISIGCCITLVKKDSYPPVRAKHVPLVIFMAVSGLIHCFATFVTNEHIPALSAALENHNPFTCNLWGYWMPFLFGLQGWVVALLLRIIVYGFVFHPQLMAWNKKKTVGLCIVICGFIYSLSTTLFLIIGYGEFQEFAGTPDNICPETSFYSKLTVLLWVVGNCAALIVCTLYFRQAVTKKFYDEFIQLWQIVVFGVLVISMNGTIALILHGLSLPLWRCIYTSLIILMHSFSFFRLMTFTLWNALTNNKLYANYFAIQQRHYISEVHSIREIWHSLDIREHFLAFCELKGIAYPLLKTGQWVSCLRAIEFWRTHTYPNVCITNEREKRLRREHEQFMDQFFKQTSHNYIQPTEPALFFQTTEPPRCDSFDFTENWLIDQLDKQFGKEFIKTKLQELFGLEEEQGNLAYVNNITTRKTLGKLEQMNLVETATGMTEDVMDDNDIVMKNRGVQDAFSIDDNEK